MNTIRIQFDRDLSGTQQVPIKLEVFDARLRQVRERWLDPGDEHAEFEVDKPGVYLARCSTASGRAVDRYVDLQEDGADEFVSFSLESLSPHESQAWAYTTKPLSKVSERVLEDPLLEGVWVRFVRQSHDGSWQTIEPPKLRELSRNDNGVSFSFEQSTNSRVMIVTAGLNISRQFSVIPPTSTVMVLVRPTNAVSDSVYPLDIVVSSDDLEAESLLTLMQRGDVRSGSELFSERKLAVRLLQEKISDPAKASVGGYFLLRTGSLEQRMEQWPANLANWFPELPDGAIIEATRLMRLQDSDGDSRDADLEKAREWLLEAVKRGAPAYTEGLRLLRQGLILFEDDKDREIRDALETVGGYAEAADWHGTTTSFTGHSPIRPAAWSPHRREQPGADARFAPIGLPNDGEPWLFLGPVTIRAAVKAGVVERGTRLRKQETGDAPSSFGPETFLASEGEASPQLQGRYVSVPTPDTLTRDSSKYLLEQSLTVQKLSDFASTLLMLYGFNFRVRRPEQSANYTDYIKSVVGFLVDFQSSLIGPASVTPNLAAIMMQAGQSLVAPLVARRLGMLARDTNNLGLAAQLYDLTKDQDPAIKQIVGEYETRPDWDVIQQDVLLYPGQSSIFKPPQVIHEVGDPIEEAEELVRFGDEAELSGSSEKALPYYNKAIQIHEKIGDIEPTGALNHWVGQINLKNAKFGEAIHAFEDSYNIASSIGDAENRLVNARKLVDVYKLVGKPDPDALGSWQNVVDRLENELDISSTASRSPNWRKEFLTEPEQVGTGSESSLPARSPLVQAFDVNRWVLGTEDPDERLWGGAKEPR